VAELPARHQRTVAAIFERYERVADDWRRPHLGASLVGRKCSRELWYIFRWAVAPSFDGRLLRLFERGNREEEWLAEDLRAIGIELHTTDESGRQYRVEYWNGHFGGSCDGIGLGFPEAPKTWHLFEAKTSNERRFRELQSKGVKDAKPEHYAQMQVYMHGLKLKRAFYVCVCKNDDQIYTERLHYVEAEAQALVAKAGTVIASNGPLSRISEDPTWFGCRFCDARPICHLEDVGKLERNCRTCLSSTPQQEGGWYCDVHQKRLSVDEQRDGCEQHLFIPSLLPWDPVGGDENARSVTYQMPDGRTVVDRERSLEIPS
jgi:hypothetical protein